MKRLHISLFGKFCVQFDGVDVAGLESLKVQEFFAYLLLHRNRPHPREALASVLWETCTTEQSRMYLRRVLWQLQQACNTLDLPDKMTFFHVEREWLQLDDHPEYDLDVTRFEEAYERSRGQAGQNLDHETAEALQQVVASYSGDLLEGWYQDWCLLERERLQNMYLAMLDKLVAYCERHRAYEMGLEYGRSILRIDYAREHTHRRMMELLYLSGDRTGAIRQYQNCIKALQDELGIQPARTTRLLYEQICADQQEAIVTGLADMRPAIQNMNTPLPERLEHILNLQQIISSAQTYIQHEIEIIEEALHIRT